MNIFVGSLPFSLEESELQEFFEEYGEVTSAKIITDKFSGRSKGFGFVEISVNSLPSESGARKVLIQPIANESELYYYNWVHDNIDKVNKATNGEVGYIHIPDMGPGGLNQFVRYYYPQLRKKALIIDDRGNGGGNVSPMIIERLRRELSMMAAGRNSVSYSKPDGMMAGPLVCLINRYSASDGDLFISYRYF
jgi:tricorn protease